MGALTAAVAAPIVLSLVRAIRRGWYPVGDNAYFVLRARDVLTEHHPLLGTWTSASIQTGRDVNNPGPLLFDIFALPAKLDPRVGVAVGAALLNIACVVVGVVVARRRGDSTRVYGVLAAMAALVWTLGSELVIDPWQPHALLFPFLLYLVIVWNLLDGDVAVLPLAVGVASLLVQSHLSYAVIVPVLGLLGLVGAGLVIRSRLRHSSDQASVLRRSARRSVVLALVVGLLAWLQPIAEQVSAEDGNLGRVLASTGAPDGRVGPQAAVRYAAAVLVVPPAWARPSAGRPPVPAGTPELPLAALALTGLGVALLLAGLRARRAGSRLRVAGVVTASAAILLAVVTIAALPLGPIAPLAAHQVRWLWPIGVFTVVAGVVALAGRMRHTPRVLAATAVVLALASVPTSRQALGPLRDDYAMGVMRSISRQLDDVAVEGPLLVSQRDLSDLRLFEPYSTPVMLELEAHGVDVVTDSASQARQLGGGRLDRGKARAKVLIRLGDDALDAPARGTRLAFHAGATAEETIAVYLVPIAGRG